MREENDEADRLYWFKELQKHYETLYRYCLRLTNGDESRADDLIQQVALRIMSHPPKPASVKNPCFYLLRSIKNRWIDSKPPVEEVALDQAFAVIAERSGREIQANLELADILDRARQVVEARFPGFNQVYEARINGTTYREINEACGENRGYADFRWRCFANEVRKLLLSPKSKSTKKPSKKPAA